MSLFNLNSKPGWKLVPLRADAAILDACEAHFANFPPPPEDTMESLIEAASIPFDFDAATVRVAAIYKAMVVASKDVVDVSPAEAKNSCKFVPLEPDQKSIDAIFHVQELWSEEDELLAHELEHQGGRTSDRDWMSRYYSAMIEAAPAVDQP